MAGKRTNTGSMKAASQILSEEKRKAVGQPRTLIQFALHKDDQELLSALLHLAEQYADWEAVEDDEHAKRYFVINESDFLEAIKLDRPHLVAEIIKRTCAGIPLDQLARKSGVEVTEKPKYYQGLSVYGKKRRDWANRGHEQAHQPFEAHRPPLLEACRVNSLETMEWFLSEAPMRCYVEFASMNKNDHRVKLLAESRGGFEAAVQKFLQTRKSLAMHCCLLGSPVPESEQTLRFLIKALPESLEFKSQDGLTPLTLSFRLHREKEAAILIKAGADQTTRTVAGENVIHCLLRLAVSSKKGLAKLEGMLALLDKRLLSALFLERSSSHPGSLTPTAQWIQHSSSRRENEQSRALLQLLLQWSEGHELNVVNGEGNAPIHVLIRQLNETLTSVLLDHDPTLALRENATGRTPFEMAEDGAIRAACSDPPPLPGHWSFSERRSRKQGWPTNCHYEITSRHPQNFMEEADKDRRNSEERVYDLLKSTKTEIHSQGRAKRRLVTLNEANEVARRLAAKKGSDRSVPRLTDHNRQEVEDAVGKSDEVSLWLGQAEAVIDEEDREDE